jgi:hypothetical protein
MAIEASRSAQMIDGPGQNRVIGRGRAAYRRSGRIVTGTRDQRP